jgi:hypothetical protein
MQPQIRRRSAVRQMPPMVRTAEDVLSEEEDDTLWESPRPASSVRRYLPAADVRAEVGRARADVATRTEPGLRAGNMRSQRFTETEPRRAVPPRRSATDHLRSVAARSLRPPMAPVSGEPGGPLAFSLQPGGRRPHWLLLAGLLMLVMLVGWVLLSALAGWWQVTLDDWQYGRPRTFQIDAVVGHNDSSTNKSHFIALNLNRHVEIIEFPGGDPSKARIYVGPVLVGPGQDLAPVTLDFRDVNGDGKPDMIGTVEDSHFVYINENGTFRPARPSDAIRLS